MKRFFRDLRKYWDYIQYETRASLKSEISGSYLGWIWLVLEPLCFMLIYTFIAGVVFGSKTDYFPIFVFAGLSIWNFFNKTVTSSVKLVAANRDIVTKVYVPKFILLLVRIFVNLFKMFVTFILLIAFMIFFKVPISWNILWVIPIIICTIIVTFGVSSIFMHFGVFIDDLVNVTAIGLKFMFYLSGIFYQISTKVPKPYNTILLCGNPIAFLIKSFRDSLIYCSGVHIIILLVWFGIGIILSIIGIRTIYKYENTYVKVMRG